MNQETENTILNNLRDLGAAVRILWRDLCGQVALLPWSKMVLIAVAVLIVVPLFALPAFFILLVFIAIGIKLTIAKKPAAPVETSQLSSGPEDEQSTGT